MWAAGPPNALLHNNIQVQYVTPDDLHFGSIRANGVAMVVVDLARFERLLGTRIDAIIGLDILGRDSPPILGETDSLVPSQLKPKPHLSSGAVALLEPEHTLLTVHPKSVSK
jgi:hypothetical protein